MNDMKSNIDIIKYGIQKLLGYMIICIGYTLSIMLMYSHESLKVDNLLDDFEWEYVGICFMALILFTAIDCILYYSTKCFFVDMQVTLGMLFIVLPVSSSMITSNYNSSFYIFAFCYTLVYFLLIAWICKYKWFCRTKINLENAPDEDGIISAMTYCVCGVFLFYALLWSRFSLDVFDFVNTYIVREEYAEIKRANGSLLDYYFSLLFLGAGQYMLAICTYFSVKKGQILQVIFCLAGYLALFSLDMQKSNLFFLGIVVLIALFDRFFGLDNIVLSIISGVILMIGFGLIEYFVCDTQNIFNFLVRRLFYVPIYQMNVWYEFWTCVDNLWLRQDFFLIQSIFNAVGMSPYSTGAIQIVSQKCFDGIVPSPNSGFLSEGIAQMGYLSIFLFPLLQAINIKLRFDIACVYGSGISVVISIFSILWMVSVFLFSNGEVVRIIVFGLVTFVLQRVVNLKIRSKYGGK